MKQLLLIFIASLFIFSCEQSDFEDFDYTLVWQDEFRSSTIDQNNWSLDIGTGCESGLIGWGNNEAQYYRAENASIIKDEISQENEYLQIESKAEYFSYTNCNGNNSETFYTSAKLHTKEKFDFTFGKIDASIKMNASTGLWHAFWMLPSYADDSYWPKSGEVDIMEQFTDQQGSKALINNLIFEGENGNNGKTVTDSIDISGSFFDDFHLYSLEWDRVSFRWYIDDVLVRTINKSDYSDLAEGWPFNESFHLILNTAVGGNLGGQINFSGNQYMYVDYVRVYQKK
jgi:beta-glucanase (GH16 family)